MARIRTIKPEFFQHEDIADLPPLHRLLFIGLWTMADREGRLEDRPRRIKVGVLPYDDGADVDAMLDDLERAGFLVRYEVQGARYIAIPGFRRHQQPHIREAASSIPPPPPPGLPAPESGEMCEHGASTVQAPDKHGSSTPGREGKGREQEGKERDDAREEAARCPQPGSDPPVLPLTPPEPAPSLKRRKPKGKPSPAGGRVLARLRELSGREYEYSPELEARLREGIPEADLLAVVEHEARPDGLRDFKGGAYYRPSTLFRPTKIRERIVAATAALRAQDAPDPPPDPEAETAYWEALEASQEAQVALARLPAEECARRLAEAERAIVARGEFPYDRAIRLEAYRALTREGGDHAA